MSHDYKIYHNPRCSKSRQTLALLQERGIEPEIIEYLKTPPSASDLKNILKRLNITPRELLRTGEADYKENKLGSAELSDQQLIDAMTRFPKLIERPIVLNADNAVIGRPPENVLDII